MVLKRVAAEIARRLNTLDTTFPMPVHAMLEFQHEDKLKDWLMSNSNCDSTEHRGEYNITKKKKIIDKGGYC